MEGFVLKILSGQQSGAEVLLSPGEYSLGSAEEDDLQFNDLSLRPGHARIRVLDDAVEIRAEAGSVTSGNGLELEAGEQQWRELEPLDIISIGMTRFAVGAATANWASIVDALKPDAPADATAEAAAGPPNLAAAWIAQLRKVPSRAWLGAMGLLLVAGLVVWLFSGGDPTRRMLAKSDPEADFAAVHQAITMLPFRHSMEVSQEVDGAIFVNGHVNTLAERRAAVNAIDATGVEAGVRIGVVEVLRSAVASLLESTGYDLDFEVTDKGVLMIRGVVLDKNSADRLLQLVQEQMLGFSKIESNIRTAEDLLAEVQELARRARINDTVLLRLDGPLIEASGLIGADKMDLWAGFIESYVRNYSGIIPMRSYVQLAREDGTPSPQIAAPTDETGRAYGVQAQDGSRIYGHGEQIARHMHSPGAGGGSAAGRVPPQLPEQLSVPEPGPGATPLMPLPPVAHAAEEPPVQPEAIVPESAQVATLSAETDRTVTIVPGTQPEPEKADSPAQVHVDPALIQLLTDASTRTDLAVGPRQELLDRFSELSRFGPLRPESERTDPKVAFLVLLERSGRAGPVASADLEQMVRRPHPVPHRFVPMPPAGDGEDVAEGGEPLPPEPAIGLQAELRKQDPATGTAPGGYEISRVSLPKPAEPVQPVLLGDSQIAAYLAKIVPARANSLCNPGGGAPSASPVAFADAGALELPELTQQLLEAWRSGLLKGATLPEGLDELISSLELIARVRKESLALEGKDRVEDPFAGLNPCPRARLQCWPGSKLDRGNLPSVMFWLDILSISESTSLAMFQPHNQALILEAGLNPKRVARCVTGLASAVDMGTSIYIADSLQNPGIVNAVAGRLDRFAISISGANLIGERYVQTAEGETLREGAAPAADSRLLHIGELGSYFRTSRGLAVTIYDPRMTWFYDG